MPCVLCDTRRPRRYCPGVHADICAPCCGKEREETIDCPLDCAFLQESRLHEKPAGHDPDSLPEPDIRVTEDFLRQHEALVFLLSQGVLRSAFETPGVHDGDVRQALESLVRTYRTLQTGLVYESRPDNPLAGAIYQALQDLIAQIRQAEAQSGTAQRIRDVEILGVFVFLLRMEFTNRNGRKRSRAFLDFLRRIAGTPQAQQPQSSLIVP